MTLFKRIKNIFPYLYYRSYQYYNKHYNESDSSISASAILLLVKSLYAIIFVVFPIDVIFLNNRIGISLREATSHYSRWGVILFILPLFFLLLLLEKKRLRRYHEMMSLWKNETSVQRRTKTFCLFFFSIFPILILVPEILVLKHFYFNENVEVKNEQVVYPKVDTKKKEERKSLQFDEIDDSHMWGIKKTKKEEIRIVEEEDK